MVKIYDQFALSANLYLGICSVKEEGGGGGRNIA